MCNADVMYAYICICSKKLHVEFGNALCCVHNAQCMIASPKKSTRVLQPADATLEQFRKSANWDREKKVRKVRGLEWPCASCDLHFPAHGFIDDSRRHASDQLANRDAIQ